VGCCATPCPAILPAQRAARAHLLWSLTSGAAGWIDRYETDDYPKIAQTLADIVLNGIAGPKSAWQTECDVTALLPALAQPETTQQAFLRAATELLNEQGYRGASADRISARLNLTKGAFYHHNENKDDLISACFDRMSTVIRDTQTLVDDLPGTGWDKLCAVSRALVHYQFSSQGPLLRLTIYGALPRRCGSRRCVTWRDCPPASFASWCRDAGRLGAPTGPGDCRAASAWHDQCGRGTPPLGARCRRRQCR
jgi:AcrR family transcriptional regulator